MPIMKDGDPPPNDGLIPIEDALERALAEVPYCRSLVNSLFRSLEYSIEHDTICTVRYERIKEICRRDPDWPDSCRRERDPNDHV